MTSEQIKKALEQGKFIHAFRLLFKLNKQGNVLYRGRNGKWQPSYHQLSDFCDYWSGRRCVNVSTLKDFKNSNMAW